MAANEEAWTAGEERMFAHIIAQEGAFFRSSLRGQPEMPEAEKLEILQYNYRQKPVPTLPSAHFHI